MKLEPHPNFCLLFWGTNVIHEYYPKQAIQFPKGTIITQGITYDKRITGEQVFNRKGRGDSVNVIYAIVELPWGEIYKCNVDIRLTESELKMSQTR